MANRVIQRWVALLAEYGCKIEYRSGKNNIRADFLFRLKTIQPTGSIEVVDVGDSVDPEAFREERIDEMLPLVHDALNLNEIALQQAKEFPSLYLQGHNVNDENYTSQRCTLQPQAARRTRCRISMNRVARHIHRNRVIDSS